MQENKQPLQRNTGQRWMNWLGMHLEIDSRAPSQTYKERTGLKAACAVLPWVILFYSATEIYHCTDALFVAGCMPAIPLYSGGVEGAYTHICNDYISELHKRCTLKSLSECKSSTEKLHNVLIIMLQKDTTQAQIFQPPTSDLHVQKQ